MYLLGGFDGSRLNDMHNIALPLSLYEEDSLRIQSRPPTSGSILSERTEFDEEIKVREIEMDHLKKIKLYKRQVEELQLKLKVEEERDGMCKICFSKEIDTVFLECAHRIACYTCSMNIKRCPFC